MRRSSSPLVLLLSSLAACGVMKVNGQPVASSDSAGAAGGGAAPGGGGGGGGGASDWDRFSIKNVKLGMLLKDAGFTTCPAPPNHSKYAVPYYKIVDPRCDAGNTCAVEDKNGCTVRLNGKNAGHGDPDELEYLQVLATTETDAPRIYEIYYYFPRQFLSCEAALKAWDRCLRTYGD
jgi:hypothetical protein